MNVFIKFGIPSKGYLNKPVVSLLEKCGFSLGNNGRKYNCGSNGIEFFLFRAKDIPKFVEYGALEAGITGYDLVKENNSDVIELFDLGFGNCRLSFAIPTNCEVSSIADIKNKMRIATEFPNITKKFFKTIGKNVEIVKIDGSCEITPYIGIADGIVDLVSTGRTLKENGLKEVEKILDSSARLIVNKRFYQANGDRIRKLVKEIEKVIKNE